jgi:DNA invertase Pin-like site-specific DNA recombinase
MVALMIGFAYMRCSGLGQLSGDTFLRQRAAIQEFATAHDIEIVRWFEEQGISGKNECDDRPAMREMFEQFNGVCVCVVERLDRLARDLIIQEGLIAKFRELGIELLSTAEDNLCSKDPTRVFIRQVLGAVAQLDRSLIVKKLRAARDRKKTSTGRCEGRKPFGRDEQERSVLALIRTLEAEGLTPAKIAEHLNNAGIASRSGGQWWGATVARIVNRKPRAAQITSVLQEQDV